MMIHPCIKTIQKYTLSLKLTIKRGTFLCLFLLWTAMALDKGHWLISLMLT